MEPPIGSFFDAINSILSNTSHTNMAQMRIYGIIRKIQLIRGGVVMKYSIEGEPLPIVVCNLSEGEKIICESGAMAWMSTNMQMETKSGGIGKMLGRALSGESIFLSNYTAKGGNGLIAFASNVPGSIKAFNITPDKGIVAQKNAFLACEAGVELSVFFQKKLGAGLFGGEGFVMQKLSGEGTAFVEFDGYVKQYRLANGQSIVIDTGYLAAMDATCSIDIKTVPGIKNALFGGEGLFNTVVTGPGNVWIHSMPVEQLAGRIMKFMPATSS